MFNRRNGFRLPSFIKVTIGCLQERTLEIVWPTDCTQRMVDIMIRKLVWICTATLLLGCGSAWAQEEEAETTIRLMGAHEAELPDAVTAEIALPDSVPEDSAAVESAQFGLDTANENRQRREDGLSKADEARERGAEMTEEALQNRENRGRSQDLPTPPDVPSPPDLPTPPTG